MELTVAEIGSKLGLPVEGDGSCRIKGIAGLREAETGDIAFLANRKYAADVARTQASAVIVPKDWDRPCAAPALLRADDPDKAFTQVAGWFAPPPISVAPGIHPTAVVAADVRLGRDVSIGPYCVLEPGVEIGDRSVLFAGCYLGHGVKVGADCRFYPHVSIREYCCIGDRAILHSGVVIGSDGFGYNVDAKGVRTKIPQIGIVAIGNDVEIGSNTTVDRARFGRTRIGDGVKIDNLVQIAHNVVIGDHAVIVAQVGISGSSEIGKHAILAGQVGVAGHIVIGEGAVVGAQSGVPNDIPPKTFVLGAPAVPRMEFARNVANVSRLPILKEKVAALEKRLAELEKKLA
ncbi:MAG TPA: UDP-3-O-(3-hydroxymyristoyl)glucosamine N-acyltransferase [Verrucomicrobia bacterium]|nr:MAG: UDP-3-O-(3-hydroxymyristoyl)glucosamine N-acyltransferase [Lentisphaerae bacterium GWF2_57_35]HBA85060.1 UDP-3-O-(3-hydroxymyristoyl)glucosamine N-acyltransferase [Verrucomicrobiota bacterium]